MTGDDFVSGESHWNVENKYGELGYFLSYKFASNFFVYLGIKVW